MKYEDSLLIGSWVNGYGTKPAWPVEVRNDRIFDIVFLGKWACKISLFSVWIRVVGHLGLPFLAFLKAQHNHCEFP